MTFSLSKKTSVCKVYNIYSLHLWTWWAIPIMLIDRFLTVLSILKYIQSSFRIRYLIQQQTFSHFNQITHPVSATLSMPSIQWTWAAQLLPFIILLSLLSICVFILFHHVYPIWFRLNFRLLLLSIFPIPTSAIVPLIYTLNLSLNLNL